MRDDHAKQLAALDAVRTERAQRLRIAAATPRPASIWSQPRERRTAYMRSRCGRPRAELREA